MSQPQELNISVDKPWGPFYFLISQLFREHVRHITGAAQGALLCFWVCPLWESRADNSDCLLSGWPCCGSHLRPALEPVSDLHGSISQCSSCSFAAICMGISDGVLSGNPLTLLPDLGWADITARFACISLGGDFFYLSATVIRLFPKHLLWEAGQQCARWAHWSSLKAQLQICWLICQQKTSLLHGGPGGRGLCRGL